MSLADIKAKIEADAHAEAEKILDCAKQQASQILKDAEENIQEIESSYKKRFDLEKPEVSRRREIVANLDVQKIDLGAKQQLIDQAFDGALDVLAGLNAGKYMGIVEALLKKAVVSGDEKVLIGRKDKYITEEWLNGFNEKNKTNLSLSKDRLNIRGGFILNSGLIDVNCSFDMLVRWIRDDIEADVVKRLFSK